MNHSGALDGRPLVAGAAEGLLLVLDEPLSFWGGLDPVTGRIIDVRHPQHGHTVTRRILQMPTGRGSSSSSTVLAEAIRAGTAPAAILLVEVDPIIIVGTLVARDLYATTMPVVLVPSFPLLHGDRLTRVDTAGAVTQPMV